QVGEGRREGGRSYSTVLGNKTRQKGRCVREDSRFLVSPGSRARSANREQAPERQPVLRVLRQVIRSTCSREFGKKTTYGANDLPRKSSWSYSILAKAVGCRVRQVALSPCRRGLRRHGFRDMRV